MYINIKLLPTSHIFYLFIAVQSNENCFTSVWICVNPKSIFVMRILRLYALNNIGNKFSDISIRLRFIDRHINVYMCNVTNEIGLLLVAAILRYYTYPINAGGCWKLKLIRERQLCVVDIIHRIYIFHDSEVSSEKGIPSGGASR